MRTRPSRAAAALCVPMLLAATACSGDEGKPAGRSTDAPAEAKQLVTTMRAALTKLKTAHFTISANVSGQRLSGSGDEKLSAGKLTALKADATVPGAGAVSIVVVGGKRYAKLPPPLATTAKPWLPITTNSDNLVVTQVAGVLDAALTAASLDGLSEVAGAATKVTKAPGAAGGTRYTVTVDPERLSAGTAKKALGTKPIPARLDLDSSGRPTRIAVKVTLLGRPTATTVTFSRFDEPVTISPPPAGQIASG